MLFEIYTFILVCNKTDKFLLLWFYNTFERTVYSFEQRVKEQSCTFPWDYNENNSAVFFGLVTLMYEGVNSLFP